MACLRLGALVLVFVLSHLLFQPGAVAEIPLVSVLSHLFFKKGAVAEIPLAMRAASGQSGNV